jgi:dTDP-4-amino-4,6-dideoxygalactose transaminase
VGNGTDALWFTLLALGVGPGDGSSRSAHVHGHRRGDRFTGATPVFVDIDSQTYNGSTLLERAITPRTKAIIPVHIFGQTADMDPILEVAREPACP